MDGPEGARSGSLGVHAGVHSVAESGGNAPTRNRQFIREFPNLPEPLRTWLCTTRNEGVRGSSPASAFWAGGARSAARSSPPRPSPFYALVRRAPRPPDDPLFATRQGGPLTPKAVAWLLDKHTVTATRTCPSLAGKRVTRHVLRHTDAMLLRAERSTCSRSRSGSGTRTPPRPRFTCTPANKIKQEAIDRIAPAGTPPGRYQPPDRLLAFLDRLSRPQRGAQPRQTSLSASPSTTGGSASSRT